MSDPEYLHVKVDGNLVVVKPRSGESNWAAVLRLAGRELGGKIVDTTFDCGDGVVDVYLCTVRIDRSYYQQAAFEAWRC
jgi:hypothetical protein